MLFFFTLLFWSCPLTEAGYIINLPPSALVSPGAHSAVSGSCSLPKLCPATKRREHTTVQLPHYDWSWTWLNSGLEINEKFSRNFATGYQNLTNFSRKILMRCIFLSAVSQNKLWAPNTRVKKPLKMANDRKDATVNVFNAIFERSNIADKRYN